MKKEKKSISIRAITDRLTKEIANERIEELISLSKICWKELGQEPWTAENYLMEMHLKWELSRYAYKADDKKLIGCLIGYARKTGYGPDRDDGKSYGFVPNIAVFPEFRGEKSLTADNKKVAHAMVEEFHYQCKKIGLPEIRLGVLNNNAAALKFYKKLGYKIIGKQIGIDNRTRTVMSLAL